MAVSSSALAIAHDGNLSNGLMLPIIEAFGLPLDRAEERARWERLSPATPSASVTAAAVAFRRCA